ncbi:MAG: HAD family phosphatase [Prevotellaceae bacterium]|nr:HAD family phosphatase [Prevotellaceae bacterium]
MEKNKNSKQQDILLPSPFGEGQGGEAIHAFLFDMDGVLYDSMPHHAIAWQQSMKKFGIHMTAADAYATEGARGIDTIRLFARKQLHEELTEQQAQEMYDEKTRIFHEMGDAPIFDGVLDLMQWLKDHHISVNVVTGSGQRPLIRRLLHDFGAFLDEDHITTAYDVNRGKPYPDPYLAGLRKAGNLQPSEAVVVENAPLGIRSGVAAGIYTVAINSGPLPDATLLAEHPNRLFPTLRDFYNSLCHS